MTQGANDNDTMIQNDQLMATTIKKDTNKRLRSAHDVAADMLSLQQ